MVTSTKELGSGFFASPFGWAFCAFALIAGFLLVVEHRAHLGLLVPYVPLALLGACVVLHSYMHGLSRSERPGEQTKDAGDRKEAQGHQPNGGHHHG